MKAEEEYLESQKFVDALRERRYPDALGIFNYLEKKYSTKAGKLVELGADEIDKLLISELVKTDFNGTDLLRLHELEQFLNEHAITGPAVYLQSLYFNGASKAVIFTLEVIEKLTEQGYSLEYIDGLQESACTSEEIDKLKTLVFKMDSKESYSKQFDNYLSEKPQNQEPSVDEISESNEGDQPELKANDISQESILVNDNNREVLKNDTTAIDVKRMKQMNLLQAIVDQLKSELESELAKLIRQIYKVDKKIRIVPAGTTRKDTVTINIKDQEFITFRNNLDLYNDLKNSVTAMEFDHDEDYPLLPAFEALKKEHQKKRDEASYQELEGNFDQHELNKLFMDEEEAQKDKDNIKERFYKQSGLACLCTHPKVGSKATKLLTRLQAVGKLQDLLNKHTTIDDEVSACVKSTVKTCRNNTPNPKEDKFLTRAWYLVTRPFAAAKHLFFATTTEKISDRALALSSSPPKAFFKRLGPHKS